MATIVKKWERRPYGCCFWTTEGKKVVVSSFKDGVAFFNIGMGDFFVPWAKLIEGCFKGESNVSDTLCEAFGVSEKLTAIQFEFNLLVVTITAENADRIEDEYNRLYDEAVETRRS